MTVSTTQNRVSYAGNGVTLAFSFPYVFFDNADLVVLLVQADGTFVQKVLGTDYTVTGAGVDAGGTVTMTAAPAVSTTLVVYRDPAITQTQAFVDNDPLPAKSISRGYDRQTLIAQRTRELVNRSFRLSDADTSGASPIMPTPTPNAFIGWNGAGSGLVNRTMTDLITISAYGTAVADKFVGDGTTKDFTLSANPGALANLDVSISGITQLPVRDFTWDGNTKLSFVSAPPAPTTPGDTNVFARYLRALPQSGFDLSAATYTPKGAGAVPRTGQDKLRETVSVEDFGAVDGSTADAAPAFVLAIATGKPVRVPGKYQIYTQVTTDLSNVVLIGDNPGYSEIISKVPSGYTMVLGTTAVPGKGGLVVRGLKFTRSSGTTRCLRVTENLDALIEYNTFSGFSDYAIEANQSDGTIIRKNLIFGSSVKAYSEMDRLVVEYNDIQAAPNHPCVEVYGGSAPTIRHNFLNWSQHEAIVLGYDSVRGDYPQSPTIYNNYIERCCQTNLAGAARPFIHVGAPYDQTGAAYAGTEVVRWPVVEHNYINADVSNANLANVMPALFERVVEARVDGWRTINFTLGSGNANWPRLKYPARNIRTLSHNIRYVDISSSGGAFQQFLFPALSMYRPVEVYIATRTITTDGTGFGFVDITAIDTGVNTLDTGRIVPLCTPQNDCRVYTTNYSVSSGAASDGSDRISFRVNVAGATPSSTVGVVVCAKVLVP